MFAACCVFLGSFLVSIVKFVVDERRDAMANSPAIDVLQMDHHARMTLRPADALLSAQGASDQ